MTGTTAPKPVRDEHHPVGELVGQATEQFSLGSVRAGVEEIRERAHR